MASVRENALILLKGLYDETGGDTQAIARSADLVEKLAMDRQAARAALRYLIDSHLVRDSREMAELPAVFISAGGVDAIEDALHAPQRATTYFPAAQTVTHNTITIGTWQGGAIQQGTVSSAQTVTEGSVDFAQAAEELEKLRHALIESADTPEQYSAIGHVASAESAAKDGDEQGLKQALASLGSMGGRVLDTANAIGVSVAAGLIQSALT